MNYFSIIFLAFCPVTLADPVFLCQSKSNPENKRYGDVQFYEVCADNCNCSFMELICLVRDNAAEDADSLSLRSESYAYSQSCPESECICNSDENWAERTKPANNNQPLPIPVYFELPAFAKLKEASELVSKQEGEDPGEETIRLSGLYTEFTRDRTED